MGAARPPHNIEPPSWHSGLQIIRRVLGWFLDPNHVNVGQYPAPMVTIRQMTKLVLLLGWSPTHLVLVGSCWFIWAHSHVISISFWPWLPPLTPWLTQPLRPSAAVAEHPTISPGAQIDGIKGGAGKSPSRDPMGSYGALWG